MTLDWTAWPAHEGYHWTRYGENGALSLVMVYASAKREGCIELWDCPGISRTYVSEVSKRQYQSVKKPT